MIRKFLTTAAVATLSVGAAVNTASAQATGFINLVGQLQPSSTPGATTPLNIDFLSGGAFPPTTTGFGTPGNVFAGSAAGIFSALTGTSGIMQDLVITNGGATVNTQPAGSLNSFLTIGGYTFAFGPIIPATGGTLPFGPITLEDTPTGVDARINLTPTITGGACNPSCSSTGILTAQFAQYAGVGGSARLFNDINNGVTITPVTFSANFTATASVVPEPSTYALLASGIAGVGFLARRRRQQA